MNTADPDSRPTNDKWLRQSDVIRCEHCNRVVGEEWVYVQAISLARRLYQLDVCGVCWDMLLAAIRLEIAGAGPGGHRALPTSSAEDEPDAGDYATGTAPLGEVNRTD
jgi:hypothetical protein